MHQDIQALRRGLRDMCAEPRRKQRLETSIHDGGLIMNVKEALAMGARLTRELTSDAHIAALAIEHGLTICSTDTDFARFPNVRWMNPLLG